MAKTKKRKAGGTGAKRKARRRANDGARNAEKTKLAILNAGVAHFAERGFRRASIRSLAKKAGKNSALVRYYFGSKRRLYADVLAYCARALAEYRLRELDQLEGRAAGQPLPLETVVRVFVAPFPASAAAKAKSGPALYVKQMARFVSEPMDPELVAVVRASIEPIQRRFALAVARAIGKAVPKDVWYRFCSLIVVTAYISPHIGYFTEVARNHFAGAADDNIWDHLIAGYCDMFRAASRANA